MLLTVLVPKQSTASKIAKFLISRVKQTVLDKEFPWEYQCKQRDECQVEQRQSHGIDKLSLESKR